MTKTRVEYWLWRMAWNSTTSCVAMCAEWKRAKELRDKEVKTDRNALAYWIERVEITRVGHVRRGIAYPSEQARSTERALQARPGNKGRAYN